jgi:hypothetical protein
LGPVRIVLVTITAGAAHRRHALLVTHETAIGAAEAVGKIRAPGIIGLRQALRRGGQRQRREQQTSGKNLQNSHDGSGLIHRNKRRAGRFISSQGCLVTVPRQKEAAPSRGISPAETFNTTE